MSMVRAMRMLNSVEIGTTDAAALQALLADSGRLSEWQALMSMRGQVARMVASKTTMAAICGSTRALGALLANPTASDVLYSADGISSLAPSAWGVYAPRHQTIDLSGTEVTRWRNSQGATGRDMVQTFSADRPLLNSIAAPNGYNSLSFDGTNDCLESAAAFSQSTAYTVFVVYRRAGAGSHGLVGNGSEGLGADSTNSAQYNAGSIGTFSNTAGASGAWALGRYRRESAAALYHSLNGGADSTAVTSGIPSFATGPTYIGRGYLQAAVRYLQGRIAEVWLLAGNGDAASSEVQIVTALLKNKYGL